MLILKKHNIFTEKQRFDLRFLVNMKILTCDEILKSIYYLKKNWGKNNILVQDIFQAKRLFWLSKLENNLMKSSIIIDINIISTEILSSADSSRKIKKHIKRCNYLNA